MLKFFRIPLLFLFLASVIGVLLRWQFIAPTRGINYTFFLHAHSHVMFLGWVFNVLYIGMVSDHIAGKEQRFFQGLFMVLQMLVAGMMLSFPRGGYDLYSIVLSTLHTLGAVVFIVRFYRASKHITAASAWYARTAMIFFIISAIGPFSLGYLMANGLGQSQWYYFSVYFYLHFQYNGFFLFGVFSLFFGLLERKKISFDAARAKRIGKILAVTCVPAYLLSVLWAEPGPIFNITGGVAAAIQLVALIMLIALLKQNRDALRKTFHTSSLSFLSVVLFAFAAKLVLQLVSATPVVALLAYALRPVVIAYLHLVLVALVSLFLFVWYLESGFLAIRPGKKIMLLFLVSFTGMEACLVLTPWWSTVSAFALLPVSHYLFFFSVVLSFSFLLLYLLSFKKPDKSHLAG